MSTYIYRRPTSPIARLTALGVAASFTLPTLAGCGSSPPATQAPGNSQLPPPVGGNARQSTGMSTRNKVILLVGAAALYYMWKKKQNAQGQPVQYYRSASTGRIYYRDPKNPRQVYWVTPPEQGIQVPADEAQQYSRYQGYNRQRSGDPFGGWDNGHLAPEGM